MRANPQRAKHLLSSRLAIACLTAAGTLALGCEDKAPPAAAPTARPIKMVTVGSQGPRSVSEYPGRISAWQHAEMAFEVPGKIIEFPFVEGDRIKQGTVIARLDPRDFQAKLQASKATVTQARADYERYQKLFDQGVTSQAELEAKRQRYQVTEAMLQTAEKAMEDANLVAPFTGIYAKKLVDDFQNVAAKQPVMILQDDSRLKIVVSVPESDMAGGDGRFLTNDEISDRIKPTVVLSTMPERPFPARLHEISTTADQVTRTFDATFVMENPADASVFPGMTAKVLTEHPFSESGSARVPGRAVFTDEAGATFVWVVDASSSTVSRRAVSVGAPHGDTLEIHSGIDSGDVVAASGVNELREGNLVRRYER
jgi:RND family efflux transporter MFP subunit